MLSKVEQKQDSELFIQEFDEAQMLNAEGLQFAQEVGRKDYIFKGKALSAKIQFQLLKKRACPERRRRELIMRNGMEPLEEMLAETEDEVQKAELHYELYQLIVNNDELIAEGYNPESHCRPALELYRKLYEKTPKIKYKKRAEELVRATPVAASTPPEPDDEPEEELDLLDSIV